MSLGHEGDACRGSGDGPTGRLGIQPVRDAGGDVRHPASYRRGVLQARLFRRTLSGLGALCDDVVGQDALVERMHLGWLPELMWTGSRPCPYVGQDRCEVTGGSGAARGPERSVTREQERTLEHASAHGDEVPIDGVAIALHLSCSPPSLQVGRSESKKIQVTRAEPQVRLAPVTGFEPR